MLLLLSWLERPIREAIGGARELLTAHLGVTQALGCAEEACGSCREARKAVFKCFLAGSRGDMAAIPKRIEKETQKLETEPRRGLGDAPSSVVRAI